MTTVPIEEIASFAGGAWTGVAGLVIEGVSPLGEAAPNQLSFLSNPKYAGLLDTTRAGAILVSRELSGDPRFLAVDNPYATMARVVGRWFASRPMPRGISSLASIASTALLGANVAVGPFTTIGENVVLAEGVSVFSNVSIEADSRIGEGSVIHSQVAIDYGTIIGRRCIIHSGAVIGADGYGFATEGDRHHKIPQIGIVRIEDDVEIGAGTTIDRAALGETVIGEGTKIDDQVMIGHNVKVGRHCLLVAQVGIGGSTELGDHVVVAGQSGFGGHLRIGSRVQVAAKSAVLHDVPDDAKVMGSPAMPFRDFARREALLKRMVKRENKRGPRGSSC